MPSNQPSSADWQAAAGLLCEASFAESISELIESLLLPLHRLLQSDFSTFDTYDAQGRMLSYRHVPTHDLSALIEPFKVHFHEHPVAACWKKYTDGGFLMHLSALMPLRQFLRTGLWNEIYIHQGVKYQLGFAGRLTPHSTWSVAAGRLGADYGPREQQLCRFLQPRFSRLFRQIGSRERTTQLATSLHTLFSQHDSAHALVTAEGRIVEISPAARALLQQNVPGGLTIPTHMPETCTELRAALAQGRPKVTAPGQPALRFTVVPAGRLQALVLRVMPDGTALVIFQPPTATPGLPPPPKLTRRETEILSWLSEGKSNPEIATLLGLSPRTVDKHCQNLFAKLGVSNRLGAALLGQHNILS